jgi:hypothetical protein
MFVKTIDKATLADLTEKNAALLAEITNSVTAEVTTKFTSEIETLKAAHSVEIAQYQKNDKIRSHAAKMNQVALGEELIASGASAEAAFDKLLSAGVAAPAAASVSKTDLAKVFEATAPAPAGNGAVQTETPEGPKTQAEAVAQFKKEGVTHAQATRAARSAYPLLFIGHYKNDKE